MSILDCVALLYSAQDDEATEPAVVVTTLPMRSVPPAILRLSEVPTAAAAAVHSVPDVSHREHTTELDTFALHHVYRTFPHAFVMLLAPPGTPSLFSPTAAASSGYGTSTTLSAIPSADFFSRRDVQSRSCQVNLASGPAIRQRRTSHEREVGVGSSSLLSESDVAAASSVTRLAEGNVTLARDGHSIFVAPQHAADILQSHPWLATLRGAPQGTTDKGSSAARNATLFLTAHDMVLHLLSLRTQERDMSSTNFIESPLFSCLREDYERLLQQWRWMHRGLAPPLSKFPPRFRNPIQSAQRQAGAASVSVEAPLQLHMLCTSRAMRVREAVSALTACLEGLSHAHAENQRLVGTLESEKSSVTLLVSSESSANVTHLEEEKIVSIISKGFLSEAVRATLERISSLPSYSEEEVKGHSQVTDDAQEEAAVYRLWSACAHALQAKKRNEHRERLRHCESLPPSTPSGRPRFTRAPSHVLVVLCPEDIPVFRTVGVSPFVLGSAAFCDTGVSFLLLPNEDTKDARERAILAAEERNSDSVIQVLAHETKGRVLMLSPTGAGRDHQPNSLRSEWKAIMTDWCSDVVQGMHSIPALKPISGLENAPADGDTAHSMDDTSIFTKKGNKHNQSDRYPTRNSFAEAGALPLSGTEDNPSPVKRTSTRPGSVAGYSVPSPSTASQTSTFTDPSEDETDGPHVQHRNSDESRGSGQERGARETNTLDLLQTQSTRRVAPAELLGDEAQSSSSCESEERSVESIDRENEEMEVDSPSSQLSEPQGTLSPSRAVSSTVPVHVAGGADAAAPLVPSLQWCVFGSPRVDAVQGSPSSSTTPSVVGSFSALFACPLPRGVGKHKCKTSVDVAPQKPMKLPSDRQTLESEFLCTHTFREGVLTLCVKSRGERLPTGDTNKGSASTLMTVALLTVDEETGFMTLQTIQRAERDPRTSAASAASLVAFRSVLPDRVYACVLCGFSPTAQISRVHTEANVWITPRDVLFADGIAFRTPSVVVTHIVCEPVVHNAQKETTRSSLSVRWGGGARRVKLLLEPLCECTPMAVMSETAFSHAHARNADSTFGPRVVIAESSPCLLTDLHPATLYSVKAVPLLDCGSTTTECNRDAEHQARTVRALASIPFLPETPPTEAFAVTMPSLEQILSLLHQEVVDVLPPCPTLSSSANGLSTQADPILPAALLRYAFPTFHGQAVSRGTASGTEATIRAFLSVDEGAPLRSTDTRNISRALGRPGSGGYDSVNVVLVAGEQRSLSLRFHLQAFSSGVPSPSATPITIPQAPLFDIYTAPLLHGCWPLGPFHAVSREIDVCEVNETTARLHWWGTATRYEVAVLPVTGDVHGTTKGDAFEKAQTILVTGTVRGSLDEGTGVRMCDALVVLEDLVPAHAYTFRITSLLDEAHGQTPSLLPTKTLQLEFGRVTGRFTTIPRCPVWWESQLGDRATQQAASSEPVIQVDATFDLRTGELHVRLDRVRTAAPPLPEQRGHGPQEADHADPTDELARRYPSTSLLLCVEPLQTTVSFPFNGQVTEAERTIHCGDVSNGPEPICLTLYEEASVADTAPDRVDPVSDAAPSEAIVTARSKPLQLFVLSNITCEFFKSTGDVQLRWACGITPSTVTLNDLTFALQPNSENVCVMNMDTLIRCTAEQEGKEVGGMEEQEKADGNGVLGLPTWRPLPPLWHKSVTVQWTGEGLIPLRHPVILLPPPLPVSSEVCRVRVFGAHACVYLASGLMWRQYSDVARVPARRARAPVTDDERWEEEDGPSTGEEETPSSVVLPLDLILHVKTPDGRVVERRVVCPPQHLRRDVDEELCGTAAEGAFMAHAPYFYDMTVDVPLAFDRAAGARLEVRVIAALKDQECRERASPDEPSRSETGPLFFLPVPSSAVVPVPVPPLLPIRQLSLRTVTPRTATIAWEAATTTSAALYPGCNIPAEFCRQNRCDEGHDAGSQHSHSTTASVFTTVEDCLYEILVVRATPEHGPRQTATRRIPTSTGGGRSRRRLSSFLYNTSDKRRDEMIAEMTQHHLERLHPHGLPRTRDGLAKALHEAKGLALDSLAAVFYVAEREQHFTVTDLEPATPYTFLVRCHKTNPHGNRGEGGVRRGSLLFSQLSLVTPWDVNDAATLTPFLNTLSWGGQAEDGLLRAVFPPTPPVSYNVLYCRQFATTVVPSDSDAPPETPPAAVLLPAFTAKAISPLGKSVPITEGVSTWVHVCHSITLVTAAGTVARDWVVVSSATVPPTTAPQRGAPGVALGNAVRRDGGLALQWTPSEDEVHGGTDAPRMSHLVVSAVTEFVLASDQDARKVQQRTCGLFAFPSVPYGLPRVRLDVVGNVQLVRRSPSACTLRWRGSCAAYRVSWLVVLISRKRSPEVCSSPSYCLGPVIHHKRVSCAGGRRGGMASVSLRLSRSKDLVGARSVGDCAVLCVKIESADSKSNTPLVACLLPPVLDAARSLQVGKQERQNELSNASHSFPQALQVLHRSAERITLLLPPGTEAATVSQVPVNVSWRVRVQTPGKHGPPSVRIKRWTESPTVTAAVTAVGQSVAVANIFDVYPSSRNAGGAPHIEDSRETRNRPDGRSPNRRVPSEEKHVRFDPGTSAPETRSRAGASRAPRDRTDAPRGISLVLEAHATLQDAGHPLWRQVVSRLLPEYYVDANNEDEQQAYGDRSGLRGKEDVPLPDATTTSPSLGAPLLWLEEEACCDEIVELPVTASITDLVIHSIFPTPLRTTEAPAAEQPSTTVDAVEFDQLAHVSSLAWTQQLPLLPLHSMENVPKEEMANIFGGDENFALWHEGEIQSQPRAGCAALLSWCSSDTSFVVDVLAADSKETLVEDALRRSVTALETSPTFERAFVGEYMYHVECLHKAHNESRNDEAIPSQGHDEAAVCLPRRMFVSAKRTADGAPQPFSEDRRCFMVLPGLLPEAFYRVRVRGVRTGDTSVRAQFVTPCSPFAYGLSILRDERQTITIEARRTNQNEKATRILAPGIDATSTAKLVVLPERRDPGGGKGESTSPLFTQTLTAVEGKLSSPPQASAGQCRDASTREQEVSRGASSPLIFSLDKLPPLQEAQRLLVKVNQQCTLTYANPSEARDFLGSPLWGPLLIVNEGATTPWPSPKTPRATGSSDNEGACRSNIISQHAELTYCSLPVLGAVSAIRVLERAPRHLCLSWRWESPALRTSPQPPTARQSHRTSSRMSLQTPPREMRFTVTAVPVFAEEDESSTTDSTPDRCRVCVPATVVKEALSAHANTDSAYILSCTPTVVLSHLRPGMAYRVVVEAESGSPPSFAKPTTCDVEGSTTLPGVYPSPLIEPHISRTLVYDWASPRRESAARRGLRKKLWGLVNGQHRGASTARDALLSIHDSILLGDLVNPRTGGRKEAALILTAPAPPLGAVPRHRPSASRALVSPTSRTPPAGKASLALVESNLPSERDGAVGGERIATRADHTFTIAVTMDGRVLTPAEAPNTGTDKHTPASAAIMVFSYGMLFDSHHRNLYVPEAILAVVDRFYTEHTPREVLWRRWLQRAQRCVEARRNTERRASPRSCAGTRRKEHLFFPDDSATSSMAKLTVRPLPPPVQDTTQGMSTYHLRVAVFPSADAPLLLFRCVHAFSRDADKAGDVCVGGDVALSTAVPLSLSIPPPHSETDGTREEALHNEDTSARCEAFRVLSRSPEALTLAWEYATERPHGAMFKIAARIQRRWRGAHNTRDQKRSTSTVREPTGAPTLSKRIPLYREAPRGASDLASPEIDGWLGDSGHESVDSKERLVQYFSAVLSSAQLTVTPVAGGYQFVWTASTADFDPCDGLSFTLSPMRAAASVNAATLVLPPVHVPRPIPRLLFVRCTATTLTVHWHSPPPAQDPQGGNAAKGVAFYQVMYHSIAEDRDGDREADTAEEVGELCLPAGEAVLVPSSEPSESGEGVTLTGLRADTLYAISVVSENCFHEGLRDGCPIVTVRTAATAP